MARQGSWPRALKNCILSLCLACGSGCMSFLNPVQQAVPEQVQACHELPSVCRSHVYIFMIHGLDPLDYGNLTGVRDYMNSLGFSKTYYGQLYHTPFFIKEIRRIHKDDAEARFVVIGFSLGANMARYTVQSVKGDGITVDLLLYMDGNTFDNAPQNRPDNAGRVVNILAHDYIWNGSEIDNAENIHVDDVWHFGTPTHPRTLEALSRELSAIATSVVIVEPVRPVQSAENEEPTPRPMRAVVASNARDEWDFLKPVAQLRSSAAVVQEAGPTIAAGQESSKNILTGRTKPSTQATEKQ